MKIERRDDDDGPLVTVRHFSSHQRPQSVNVDEGSVQECLEAVIARSMSERPDEIFDMNERYAEPSDNFSILSEERDDCSESSESRYERQQRRGKEENYISDIIEKFKLKEVIQRLQAYPNASLAENQLSDMENEHAIQIKNLKEKLEKAERKSKDLAGTLEEAEKIHGKESLVKENKISALEIKMALQKHAYTGQLESEQLKMKSLEDKLGEMKESCSENIRDTEKSRYFVESKKNQGLEQKVKVLEFDVANLNTKRAALEAALDARESTYDYYISAAKNKIKKLEQTQDEKYVAFEAERAQFKKLELAIAKAEVMRELDRKKLKSLHLSEAKTQTLLKSEKKKSQALETLVDKMKIAMRRLNKKAILLESAQDQIENLKKEVGRRDLTILSIKKILVCPIGAEGTETRPIQVDGKQKVRVYAKKNNTITMAGMLGKDHMSNTENEENCDLLTQSDTSSGADEISDVSGKTENEFGF